MNGLHMDSTIPLTRLLRDLPSQKDYRFTDEARIQLLEGLFNSLACNGRYLHLLFPKGNPHSQDAWNLSKAQGAIEGAEYSAAARGKPCGHIFKNGEATYRCKTCSLDETSVLCAKCFEGSDHRNHSVFVSISPGNSGCCDCGDPEAWRRNIKCAIHTATESASGQPTTATTSSLPDDLRQSIKRTIGKAMDYMCDVISCSPEQLRLPKTEQSVIEDEQKSRLLAKEYEHTESEVKDTQYALVLWNDEKHTVPEVQNQVTKACKKPRAWGMDRAQETHIIGRSILDYDTDINSLLEKSKIVGRIKLTVTVRSARDTFREQMVGTIIEWLVDIAGCTVGDDADILRVTICEELLGVWKIGSMAWNTEIGSQGIDDHEFEETQETLRHAQNLMSPEIGLLRRVQEEEDRIQREMEGEDDDEDGEGREDEEDGMEVDGDEDIDMEASTGNAQQIEGGDSNVELSGIFPDTGLKIPSTPGAHHKRSANQSRPNSHWLTKPVLQPPNLPVYEDLKQRVRLDWLIMFDLRMWKKARVDLRELYIGTVVAIPQFKRILGLRFAGLYTTLSQLYLIADREPDHSIINLSLQMLTTPSITSEVVSRGNFLTNLMAILYTFLTTRQVGYPVDVNPEATLAFDAGSLTNRRMYHFFHDMRYLFASDYVRERLRTDHSSMAQFLDLVRLHQGICPNIRAIATHVEYESDAWICASLITRETNKLSRQFADAFKTPNAHDDKFLAMAIQYVARSTIRNSLGLERGRFTQAEVKEDASFHDVGGFGMDINESGQPRTYRVIKYYVDRQPMSFHHALHYALSWLIEVGKAMPAYKLKSLLTFTDAELGRGSSKYQGPDDFIVAMFDYPLRVFVWLSQMKAGMWVRNGFSLRHQMNTYKGVSQRDLTFYRDIFMLQVAMITVDPSRMLMTILDRFELIDWFKGKFVASEGKEGLQTLDLAEDLIHLLIVLLSDRLLLTPSQGENDIPTLQLQREIAHVLCTGPSSFSDISQKIPERLQDLEIFQEILAEMTNFKPPDGLNDTGMYELKGIYREDIDPYILQFSKNQREEAENMYKQHMSKKTGVPEADIVFELKLRPLKSGTFTDLAAFTRTAVFGQIVYYALAFGITFNDIMPDVPESRVEAFLHIVLYLVQLAVAEDDTTEGTSRTDSFVLLALEKEAKPATDDTTKEPLIISNTIVQVLCKLKTIETYKSCVPKIDHILQKMKEKRPNAFAANSVVAMDTDEDIDDEAIKQQQLEEELAKKKALAKQRQANIMAQFQAQQQSFLNNLGLEFDSDEPFDSADEGAMDEDATETEHPAWPFPTGNCILCQEDTNDSRVYGTFALIKESSILRQTDLKDPDYVREVITTPDSLDRSADKIRPFGVAGMNRDVLKKLAEDGTELTIRRQGLGKGYPNGSRFVRKGPVAVGCGHLMHFHCFEHYHMATQRRHAHQISRQHPERLGKKEFICPLCRALGNAFLPIVWKPKQENSVASMINTAHDFDTWLSQEIGPVISRLQKAAENGDKSTFVKYKEQFFAYGHSAFIDKMASKLSQVTEPSFTHKHLSSENIREAQPTIVLPVGGGNFENQLSMTLSVATPQPLRTRSDRPVTDLEEMDGIYRRLRDTLMLNKISSKYSTPGVHGNVVGNELCFVDTLVQTLGFSISSIEIALRGVESDPGTTILNKITQSNLTHLRILAETIQAYICIGGLQDDDATVSIFGRMHKDQMVQLFFGHPQIYDTQRSLLLQNHITKPLLTEDIFVYLSDASLCMCTTLNIEFKYVLNLCYIAEMVKCILAIGFDMCEIDKSNEQWSDLVVERAHVESSDEAQQNFVNFYNFVIHAAATESEEGSPWMQLPPSTLALILKKYSTTFMRKVVILMHTRYGVYFPDNAFPLNQDESEHDRLRQLLRLPSHEDIFAAHNRPNTPEQEILRSTIAGWCKHWRWTCQEVDRQKSSMDLTIALSHPSIFELVGLPLHYDTLVEEAMRRKCPTTGRELQDPVVCLFCGDVVCSQGLCCLEDNKGGANRHMNSCGKEVGLFINIRKCHVLYLHGGLGAWAHAPYLDKHGEPDPNLRRNRQLFLNQKRYDAFLRTAWLQHQIPTIIARRLEPDFNTGGWDTL